MSRIIIAPSILSADFANLERDVKAVENAGADWIHVDVMDGHFVPNITIGAPVVKALRKVTKLPLDVHLMIENPLKYVPDFARAGADIITFHEEAAKEATDEVIDLIKSFNIKVGLSIKPKTAPDTIKKYLSRADMVLIMTVEPGFGGQSFMPDCAEKIKTIKAWGAGDLIIQVDGGINAQTGALCKEYGATSLVAGNYIYKADNIKAAIASLK